MRLPIAYHEPVQKCIGFLFFFGGALNRDELIAAMRREIAIINRTMADFGIDAGTQPQWVSVAGSSFIAYGIRLGRTQSIAEVVKRRSELQERLSAARRQPTAVRWREMPFALEVPHPAPVPLDWKATTMRIGQHRLIAGRNYSASPAQDYIIDLDNRPHVLIAGTTGSGKSTMLRMALSSLAYNSEPDTLRIVLVDRKNEDLIPFANLPHVELCAWTLEESQRVVRQVKAELHRRIHAGGEQRQRIVLVIDELAMLADDSIAELSSILAVGRSKRVNVIAATQHPAVRLIGDKANYSVRLVGQVIDANTAALATGRKQSGAELLPGAGAFLAVDGAKLDRIQSYNLPNSAADGLVEVMRQKWQAEPLEPVRTSSNARNTVYLAEKMPVVEPVLAGSAGSGVQFPLPRRQPTNEERKAIRELHARSGSKNQTVLAAYGMKNGDTYRWVNEALNMPELTPNLRMGGAR